MVGAWGTVDGVTEFELPDDVLVPAPFEAVTLKVYGVPAVRPLVIVHEVPADVQVPPPELAVTVYPVMAEPPVRPAVHDTVTWGAEPKPTPATLEAVPTVGAWGTVAGVTLAEAAEAALVAAALVAVTLKV
jgi:hypothetical protein